MMTLVKGILLVEDDIEDQEFFIEAISDVNHAVLHGIAANGKEALEKLATTPILPDIIFMDIRMPVMDGLECLAAIIRNPITTNIPVIMLSNSLDQVAEANSIGAMAFIKKPTLPTVLGSKLSQILNVNFTKVAPLHSRVF